MDNNATCPIWSTPARTTREPGKTPTVVSPRAGGEYVISRRAIHSLNSCHDQDKAKLTSWLVEQRRLGNSQPRVSEHIVDDAKKRRPMSVFDRADAILGFLAIETQELGLPVSHRVFRKTFAGVQTTRDEEMHLALLAACESVSTSELSFLMAYLERRNFIEYTGRNSPLQKCTLTVEGYARLAEIEQARVPSSRAFVAMWFDDSMAEAWQRGFEPAIRDAGYDPVRIDQKDHVNRIDDEIIAEIRRSRFVVADFTQGESGARGGVYYEAGFAHGLALPVVFTCHKDSFDDVHFDTRQYNHIVWTEPSELRERLSSRIAAVIAEGPATP